MVRLKETGILLLLMVSIFRVSAQSDVDNSRFINQDSLIRNNYSLNFKHLIVPGVFIGVGIASLHLNGLQHLNSSTRNEIKEDQPKKLILDNYTQYIPAAMVYGLNAAGIKGKHDFRDRTIIYATSQLVSAAMVVPLKRIVKEERPDGSNDQSFPSGHTTTAFSSAQFMFREYKDTDFWLSISGYSFAVFTGAYRTINDKHWVGDVVAGAGLGILSTELSYWLFPKINGVLGGHHNKGSAMVMPYYQDKGFGLSMVKRF
jgi:membrane-associated phospholipid phosphatase